MGETGRGVTRASTLLRRWGSHLGITWHSSSRVQTGAVSIGPGTNARALRFKQSVKGLPRIFDLGWGRRCFSLHRDPGFEILAVIAPIFGAHALGDRLSALESAASIKMETVLAGMQIRLAMRALAVRCDSELHRHRPSTHGAPKDLPNLRELGGARPG